MIGVLIRREKELVSRDVYLRTILLASRIDRFGLNCSLQEFLCYDHRTVTMRPANAESVNTKYSRPMRLNHYEGLSGGDAAKRATKPPRSDAERTAEP